MDFKVIMDRDEAKNVWDALSPHETIDDEFDFRETFIVPLAYELFFLAGYKDGELIGLLPLQKNNGKGLMPPYAVSENIPFLEFFGGDDTDGNTVLSKNQDIGLLDEFITQLPLPAYLAPLAPKYENFPRATYYETKYFLNIAQYHSSEDFLRDKWSSDSRKKILQQVRKIQNEHKIEILENNYEDIRLLVEFNKKRFGNTSSFSYPYRQQIFEKLIDLYDVFMQTIVVDGEKEAVSYGIHYKNTYVGMNAGVNGKTADVAKFLILLQIDKAIELGCTLYDAGKGDSGWKESYKLEKTPQYRLAIDGTIESISEK